MEKHFVSRKQLCITQPFCRHDQKALSRPTQSASTWHLHSHTCTFQGHTGPYWQPEEHRTQENYCNWEIICSASNFIRTLILSQRQWSAASQGIQINGHCEKIVVVVGFFKQPNVNCSLSLPAFQLLTLTRVQSPSLTPSFSPHPQSILHVLSCFHTVTFFFSFFISTLLILWVTHRKPWQSIQPPKAVAGWKCWFFFFFFNINWD